MTYCHNCGKELPSPDVKFCPYCGAQQIIQQNVSNVQPPKTSAESVNENEVFEIPKPKIYDLGIQLENTTATIFEKMGYVVQKRVRLPTRTSAVAEIDLILTRGNRRIAVECKNYKEDTSVGVGELRKFKNKMEDVDIASGKFVTNTLFSDESKQFADSTGIELWDGINLREKFFAMAIGRLNNPSLITDPILPIRVSFLDASSIKIKNSNSVHLFNKTLLFHPYFLVKYRLHMNRKDPTGKVHKINEDGEVIIDYLDGDIINKEKSMLESVTSVVSGMFKKEERLESMEDNFVVKDLMNITPIKETILKTSDYDISSLEPQLSDSEAIKIVKGYVIKKNTINISYEQKKENQSLIDALNKPSIKVVPKVNEIEIRGTKLVYVPKWDLEFESGENTFRRKLLASSHSIIIDAIAKCRLCVFPKRDTIYVCEDCGKPLCEKHVYQEGSRWLCEDHISQTMKDSIKGQSVFGKLFKK